MEKAVVIYESKYGSTKKYAEWIASELSCDLLESKKVQVDQLDQYDTVIFGGGLYAGGFSGIKLLKRSFERIKNKKLVLFTCGLADPMDADNVSHIKQSLSKALTPEMQRSIRVFHLRGGIDYSKLGIIHKAMMAMMRKMLSRKVRSALRDEDRQMLDTYGKVVDFTDKSTIEPLLAYVRG